MPKISAFENILTDMKNGLKKWIRLSIGIRRSETTHAEICKGIRNRNWHRKIRGTSQYKNGVEPSSEMRKIALERGLNVVDGVAENLPFEDNSFDLVLMVTTVCFVDDVLKSFKECFRVLKNNGTILIGFVDRESTIGKIYQANKEKVYFTKKQRFILQVK